ncbi:MAG: YjgB family protein [Desulfocucumaceae bacterium]
MVKTININKYVIVTVLTCSLLLAGCSAGDKEKPGISKESGSPPLSNESDKTPDSDGTGAVADEQKKNLISRVMDLARQGRVLNSEFALETTVIDEVEKKWGEPDKKDYVPEAKGTFVTYSGRGVVFGFNKGSQIFDIRSYDKDLKKITLAGVREVLGPPANSNKYNNQDILGYAAGDKFKIRFVFPQATAEKPNPALDHVSVFYPQGSANLMADDPGLEW